MSYMPERPWSEPEEFRSPAPPPASTQQPTYNYLVSGRTFFRAGVFWAAIGLLALWFGVVAIGGIADELRGKHGGDAAWNGILAILGPVIWFGCWFLACRAFRNWTEFKKGQLGLIYGRR